MPTKRRNYVLGMLWLRDVERQLLEWGERLFYENQGKSSLNPPEMVSVMADTIIDEFNANDVEISKSHRWSCVCLWLWEIVCSRYSFH